MQPFSRNLGDSDRGRLHGPCNMELICQNSPAYLCLLIYQGYRGCCRGAQQTSIRRAELRYHHAGRPALTLQWRFSLGQEAVSNGRTLRTCHPGFLEDVTAGTCQPHCAVKHLG